LSEARAAGASRTILITGGSGFIGTNLARLYHDRGDRVVNLDIAPPRNPDQAPLWVRQDVRDREGVRDVVARSEPSVIVHLAARTDLGGAGVDDYSANTAGVSAVIEAAAAMRTRPTVVFASSMLVCRLGYAPAHDEDYCPVNPYGASKVEGERRVRREAGGRFPWAIVRPTSIWGPWFGPPYRGFFDAVRAGWYIHPRGVLVRRHYGFVLNTVRQIDAVVEHAQGSLASRVVYVGDYDPIDVKRWADVIRRQDGARPVRALPLSLFRAGAAVGDVLAGVGVAFPLTSYRLRNLVTPALYDLSPLRGVYPDLPYGLEEGVRITREWMDGPGATEPR
jgi:nucleoside-diphosphate-sugar epimerase